MSIIDKSLDTNNISVTDAGGVSARRGFKYQDHVAVFFVLAMIADKRIASIECETADDILLWWNTGVDEFPEYIQVKTTEDDKKWSQTEILKRTITKSPTSLVEKSLLCDNVGVGALFRIVSRRDTTKAIACLKLERDNRLRHQGVQELGSKLAKKWSTKSSGGIDLAYWAKAAVWQVTGDIEFLKAKNQQTLARTAEAFGANPTHSHVEKIYDDFLRLVDEAASASKITEAEKKVISRDQIIERWKRHLGETDAAIQRTSKPYRHRGDAFFTDLYHITEVDVHRALSSYDARYERGLWRSSQLADHLVDWLPEVALKASDLVSIRPLNLRRKMREAVRSIKQRRSLASHQLLAETLLHAIVRQSVGSEPIACKLFYETSSGLRSFGSAHIVHSDDGDQLWLGHARIATARSYSEVVQNVVADLEYVLDADFLKEEREIILTLREPQHLLPTTLEAAFSRNAPVDDLIANICIPVLVGYDSAVLAAGYAKDYQEKLVVEVTDAYEALKPSLPRTLGLVNVHIFLVPISPSRI